MGNLDYHSSAYQNRSHSLTSPAVTQGAASDLFSKFSIFREETHKHLSSFINSHRESINKGLNSLVEEVCQLQTQMSIISNEKNLLQTQFAMITNERNALQTQVSIITNEKSVLLQTVANLHAEIQQQSANLPIAAGLQEAEESHHQLDKDPGRSKMEIPNTKEVNPYPEGTTLANTSGDDVHVADQTKQQEQVNSPQNDQMQITNITIPMNLRKSKWMTERGACKICGKIYLKSHLYLCHYLTHSDKQEFECSLCGKLFEAPIDLMDHMKVHGANNKKPFHCCVHCGKHFKNKDKFDTHLRIHNGIKPYPCESCNKSFVSKSYLDIHKRIHTGEEPYVCELCAAAYISKPGKSANTRMTNKILNNLRSCGQCG